MLCVLLMMLFGASSDVSFLIGEDAYDVGGDFAVDDGPAFFAYDIDTEFLLEIIRMTNTLVGLE
jgi:hypothetical protein